MMDNVNCVQTVHIPTKMQVNAFKVASLNFTMIIISNYVFLALMVAVTVGWIILEMFNVFNVSLLWLKLTMLSKAVVKWGTLVHHN